MEGFTADQASRLTNCTPHQLRYWDRIGLVEPSVQSTGGRPGIRRLYSFRDLVALRVIRSLLEGGMSLQKVRRAIQFLRRKAALEEHLSEIHLVTDGRSIFEIQRSEGELMDALKEGQLAFFMTIDEVAGTVDSRAAAYLYDQEEFLAALRRVGSSVERQLPPSTRRRVRAAT